LTASQSHLNVISQFSLDEPFDHMKLKFFMYYVDNFYVVSHMMYEDIEID